MRLVLAGSPGQLGRHQDKGIEGRQGVCEDALGGLPRRPDNYEDQDGRSWKSTTGKSEFDNGKRFHKLQGR